MDKLPREFYTRDTLSVARELVGTYLVRAFEGELIAGRITETEAYRGPVDKASHAYGGRNTPRTRIMFGPPGFSYIYFIYGMYYCLNVVTEPEGSPCAVLLRGLELVWGLETAARQRYNTDWAELSPYQRRNFTNGPGKLCKALGLSKTENGIDLLGDTLFICETLPGVPAVKRPLGVGKRIGIDYAQEARDYPWRFYEREGEKGHDMEQVD